MYIENSYTTKGREQYWSSTQLLKAQKKGIIINTETKGNTEGARPYRTKHISWLGNLGKRN